MKKKPTHFRTPGFKVLLAESGVSEKIQLAKAGTFWHADYGQFAITPEMLKKMSENFAANVRGVDLAIDYSHENEDVAAGWIKSVELDDGGQTLWAQVDWTPAGQKALSDKEFRYISPEFMFNYKDNETLKEYGPTLLGAGLTNRPTIKRMEPVTQLSEMPKETPKPVETPKPKPQPKGVTKMGDQPMPDQAAMDAMTPEQLKALCVQLMSEVKKMSDAAKAAAGDKAAAEQKVAAAERKLEFAKMLSEGKVVAAQEKHFIDGNMVEFAKAAGSVNLSEKGNGGNPGSTGSAETVTIETREQAEAEVSKLAQVKLTEKSASSLGDAIKMVLKEKPELSKKLYNRE